MDNLVYRAFYTAFNRRIIIGIFTRDYGYSLAAINHLENLAMAGAILGIPLPDKSKYLSDMREIVEGGIALEYGAMHEIPVNKLEKDEIKGNSRHYKMESKYMEEFEAFARKALKDLGPIGD